MSYLTREELEALQSSGLHRITPYLIEGVSTSIFSVARYSGKARVNGDEYTYLDATDELIRDDVLKWLEKRRKAAVADKKRAAKVQRGLFDGE